MIPTYYECPDCKNVHTALMLKVFGDYRRSIESKALSNTLVCHRCGHVFMITKYRSASKLFIAGKDNLYLSHGAINTAGKLPGGSFEAGENAIKCLQRELYEESGYRLSKDESTTHVRCIGRILQFGFEWHNTYLFVPTETLRLRFIDMFKPDFEDGHITRWMAQDQFTKISQTQVKLCRRHFDSSIRINPVETEVL